MLTNDDLYADLPEDTTSSHIDKVIVEIRITKKKWVSETIHIEARSSYD